MVTITLTDEQVASVVAQAGGVTPPVQPTPPPIATGPLDAFNYLMTHANSCVAWRYVMQAGPEVKGALIAQLGADEYNRQINNCSYNCPQAWFVHGVAWWIDPAWTGPYPESIGIPTAAWLSCPFPVGAG